MNKSYSKIRHIQEVNQKLEKMFLIEQSAISTPPTSITKQTQPYAGSDRVASMAANQKQLNQQTIDINTWKAKDGKTTFDQVMEKFREGLYSDAGIAIEAALDLTGWGAPAVYVAFGTMFAYDVYLATEKGNVNYLNLIADLLGIVSGGLISKFLSPIVKSGKSFARIEEAIAYIKSSSVGAKILPYLKMIETSIGVIGQWISKGITWIVENTNIKMFKSIEPKITSFFNDLSSSLVKNVEGEVEWNVNKTPTEYSHDLSKNSPLTLKTSAT